MFTQYKRATVFKTCIYMLWLLRKRSDLISRSSKRTIEHQRIVGLVLIIFLDLNQFFRDITQGKKRFQEMNI